MSETRIVVTGASRGIGLEYCRRWLGDGRRVFGLARDPEGSDGLMELVEAHPDLLAPVTCDVSDEASVRTAADAVGEAVDGIEILVNNAGVMGDRSGLEDLDMEELHHVFDVNAVGPLRVTRAFLPLLRQGREPRRLIHMTSLMGSIDDNESGGVYPYRMSKCALNMASRSLARDLEGEAIASVVLHPGWVRTDMGGASARVSTAEAVRSLAATIESIDMGDTGRFYDRDGEPLPW